MSPAPGNDTAMPPDTVSRILLLVAGLLGAAGVAAAAGASHAGDTHILGALALIALTQAPALLALALYGGGSRILRTGAALIALGAVLFSADLAARHFLGDRLFPMSAPFGGIAMIAGWLALAAAALVPGRRF
jgi:uncharacterized membrane protein YgdD (TMEM256/DUF423 family)